jgi:hypothetical protein
MRTQQQPQQEEVFCISQSRFLFIPTTRSELLSTYSFSP